LVDGAGEQTAAAVAYAISKLDRGNSKGVIHRNAAARTKSRLMKHLNALGTE
jgi:small subunit ribosomal protein S20